MCTILLAWRHRAGAPIVIAANRDELLARPTLDPHVLREDPLVVGGQDALAGGTWLAIRGDGTVAAVTNRRVGSADRDPTRRSRGELPLLLLETQSDDEALAFLRGLQPTEYNPFNALYVSPRLAVVAHAHGDAIDVRLLDPGLHVLTIHDVDDRTQRKVKAIAGMLDRSGDDPDLLSAMETILEERGEPGREGVDAACVEVNGIYGTVSSSSVVVHDDGRIVYRHAPGPPCETTRHDVSALFAPRPAETEAQAPQASGSG